MFALYCKAYRWNGVSFICVVFVMLYEPLRLDIVVVGVNVLWWCCQIVCVYACLWIEDKVLLTGTAYSTVLVKPLFIVIF